MSLRQPDDLATALTVSLALLALVSGPVDAAESASLLPDGIVTHEDGRLRIKELFESYLELRARGWELDVIADSEPAGAEYALPIIALRTPHDGAAVWILAGIHGEEPAGPNAIAAAIDELAALGETRAVVLLPLLNPHGYARNWRYLNTPVYSETIEGQSVGDSSHMLPQPDDPARARAAVASSPEAGALTRYIVALSAGYPPRYSIDLHEDNFISEGYVYSQGEQGADDPLAVEAVRVLQDTDIPIKMSGRTRFDEEIIGGIIGPVIDSSIDEFMSGKEIIVDGQLREGPDAPTVLVFETPARNVTLERRREAHLALVRRLAALIARSPMLE